MLSRLNERIKSAVSVRHSSQFQIMIMSLFPNSEKKPATVAGFLLI